jgi:anthranilate synthase/aminodeoxychorismate synthase-like glutamine amidotransferase
MIDNYDSFTYNLVQYFSELGERVSVFRNDKISITAIRKMKPEVIVISPGPGSPEDAGVSNEVISQLSGEVPILGVCLGHQCIGRVFGGKVIRAKKIMHGKTSQIFHDKKGIFQGIENPFTATRYHSLLVDRNTFSKQLELTAWTKDREIMGLRHKQHKTFGVQFHPESILTPSGKKILKNFLRIAKK